MERKPARLIRAGEALARRTAYTQRLNPRSRFHGTSLSGIGGLERAGVSAAWLPPGRDSFAYHAHHYTEEWLYMVAGRAIALVDGQELEVGPGDFLAFPAPQVAHLLCNRSGEEVFYLMGGEHRTPDILDYPHLGKTYLLVGGEGPTAFYELGAPSHPFGADRDDEVR